MNALTMAYPATGRTGGPVSAAPDLLAALMQSIEREKQRRRDAVPCDKCGGDRLRADFVNPDRCHAPTTEAQR